MPPFSFLLGGGGVTVLWFWVVVDEFAEVLASSKRNERPETVIERQTELQANT